MRDLHEAPESLFWYWVAERHAIFLRRQAGQPKPWTTDPILRDYKFTNPFRENDRGTVWLRENFLIQHYHDDPRLVAGNICWYRMFNWWGTGETLGWRTSWDVEAIKIKLHHGADYLGHQVFTGAHIVYSPPGRSKIDAIVDVCADLWTLCQETAWSIGVESTSLQYVFELLKTVHCVGNFMAYEMVTDMRHTKLLEKALDIMTWANMGPGAKRGLQRLGMDCRNQEEGCESMRALLRRAPFEYVAQFAIPGGIVDLSEMPQFEMRDIEHSLCEFDKYCRVKFGEGEPRSKFDGDAE
jgi:hypothetical protein